jgi:hypothetical protein
MKFGAPILKKKEAEQAWIGENWLKPQPHFTWPSGPPEGQSFIIIIIIIIITEASRSHSHTPQSVELLWTGDQPKAETST